MNYQNIVLQAAAEVESSLHGFVKSREQLAYLTESAENVRQSLELSRMQYTEGEINFLRVDSARAALSEAEAAVASSKAGLDQARANLGEPGDANVRIREAIVQLEDAQLYLGWTSMYAPFDGYITNLVVNEGQFGAPGSPIAAFVDSSSFRVDGYFQESKLRHIKRGDRANMTLMSHPDIELTGVVDSIGYAINPPKTANTEGAFFLVPQIQPTFDWIRLPQRVPVRIRLEDVPEDIQLVSGMTTSVAIRPSRED